MLSIDVEASGPCPGKGDMIQFAAVRIDGEHQHYVSPIIIPQTDEFSPSAYSSIGMTREEHLQKATHTLEQVAKQFFKWLDREYPGGERIVSWSDNPAFDWQWINHMFHTQLDCNPLGHSMRRIGDLAAGLAGKPHQTSKWKKKRTVKHTHYALDDARGNAGALRTLLK